MSDTPTPAENTAAQNPLSSRPIGDLVAEDFRLAQVFSHFGIDFCCGGRQTLAQACDRVGANSQEVEHALSQVTTSGVKDDKFNSLGLEQLMSYIEQTHHSLVREKAPLLIEYSQRMVRAHGEDHAEVEPLAILIQALVDDLLPHLHKEEQILFPAIRAMARGESFDGCFGHIGNPINVMEHEHREASRIFAKLHQVTNHYQLPEHACGTWRACYTTLAELEADLGQHIHLENNILFEKALALAAA